MFACNHRGPSGNWHLGNRLAKPAAFLDVGFKEDSEIGMQIGNGLIRRNDGRLFILSMVFPDPVKALDPGKLIPLMKSAPDILFKKR